MGQAGQARLQAAVGQRLQQRHGQQRTRPRAQTQAQADALAAYLASTSATEAPLVRITLDNDSTTRLQQIRDVELNDRVIATEAITGGTLDGFVEQVTHRITNGGLRHECELVIGARTRMVGIYSASAGDAYSLSTYTADSPTEPPPYATYGF